jgi:nucleoside-diphosphate-sugar epimerase
MARYFVTGATGFVGGAIARQLVARGDQVVALARAPERAGTLRLLGVEIVGGDITDRASLRAPMRGVDGVFHCAAWYKTGERNPDAERINVDGTRHVLDVMREVGVPKGVYTSTIAVFGHTHGRVVDERYRHDGAFTTVYEHTKWRAHYEVALPAIEAGLPLVVVQPGVVYGPGDTSSIRGFWLRHLRGQLPAVPRNTAFSWGYIDDTAHGHLLAMDHGTPGQSYIIAGPSHSLVEALRIASRFSGKLAPRVTLPTWPFRLLAPLAGLVERVVPLPTEMTAEGLRVVGGVTYVASSAKAERELGFTTRSLEEGLQLTIEHELRELKGSASSAPAE